MSDRSAEIDRLLQELSEALDDEQDAASRASQAAQELEDMGVDPSDHGIDIS